MKCDRKSTERHHSTWWDKLREITLARCVHKSTPCCGETMGTDMYVEATDAHEGTNTLVENS